MAVYSPQSLGITAPAGGFQEGGWYQGRQFVGGTLSDPGTIHPSSNQQGAGQAVSAEVNAQSAAQQGVTPQQFESYLQQQRQQGQGVAPVGTGVPGGSDQLGSGFSGMQQPQGLNLPELYQSLYDSAGIKEREQRLNNAEKQFLEAQGKITDNPFLSSSIIDQRLQRLRQKYEEQTQPLRSEIEQSKADIETQLNLQTKQFDIESQQARDALSTFNSLLDSGALDGASGMAIANLTRQTGIPSSMIQSAIKSRSKKDKNTQLITSTAENGEVYSVLIDKDTGDVIKRTSLGVIGNVQRGSSEGENDEFQTSQNLISDIQRGATLRDLVGHYTVPGGLSVDDVYRQYNTYSPYGSAKEDLESVKEGRFVQ